MFKKIILLGNMLLCLLSTESNAQKNHKKTIQMTTKASGLQAVTSFFTAFSKGNFPEIINAFHKDASIFAVRSGVPQNSIYGTYKGIEGVQQFLQNLGATFDTKAFNIEHMIADGNKCFANGTFTHVVKATGKTFSSAWSLFVIEKEGKILEYHFYEDSEKFVEANSK